jgi:hypothetical protein
VDDGASIAILTAAALGQNYSIAMVTIFEFTNPTYSWSGMEVPEAAKEGICIFT